jgi:hypothetical protein
MEQATIGAPFDFQLRNIDRWFWHPNYNSTTLQANVGLIKLKVIFPSLE